MEEQRIGKMYVNLVAKAIVRFWDGLFGNGFRRSPVLPWLLILVLLILPSFGWYLHEHGQFSTLKREIKGETQGPVVAVSRPGGADPIILTRQIVAGSTQPEFLSATLLPGLGMSILQITANLPGRGETSLLAAPTLEAMADGTAGPRIGTNDTRGALETPWAGGLSGVISPLGTTLATTWHGKTIEVPRTTQAHGGAAEGGMLASSGADTTDTHATATGPVATGLFHATDFESHWPSRTETTVAVALHATTLDITVISKNVGDQPEPVGVGWHPRFAITSGQQMSVELRFPNGEKLEVADRVKEIPSGRVVTGGMIVEHFQGRAAAIGAETINESLVHLKPAAAENWPSAEMRDPASGFGLRMVSQSNSIRELRVMAPAGGNYVSLGMQTNFDDPLGKEWTTGEPSIQTLLPGESVEWKVRLEIFALPSRAAASSR